MKLYVEIDYAEDDGEDIGAVANAITDDLLDMAGVAFVRVHGPEATLIPSPKRDYIERG